MSVPRGLRPWIVAAGAVALLGLVAGGALALSGRAWVLVVTTRLPLALAVGGVVVAGAVVAVGPRGVGGCACAPRRSRTPRPRLARTSARGIGGSCSGSTTS
ncbi:hypothetical protein [Cellulomonas sp. FA1]|uniref:hypothetical protein n=1 Tax=Cellulomonas sp. FA1 TaxID=1346710 RepID=UPI00069B1409|nr:hypothetical protein [Cellulomonas sp. FA1]